jgi:hypothetical protein
VELMTYEAEALKIGRTDDLRIKLLAKSRLGAQCTIEHRPLLHGASHGTMRQPCAASRRLVDSLDIHAARPVS